MGSSTPYQDTNPNPSNASAQFEDTKTKARSLWSDLSDDDLNSASTVDQLADMISRRFGDAKDAILQKLGRTDSQSADDER